MKIGSQQILMDFGLIGSVLVRNMKKLGIDPDKITKALLSHGHSDHIWGLKSFLNKRNKSRKLPLYLHKTALKPKRAHISSILLWNAGHSKLNAAQEKKVRFIFNQEPTKITSLISTTGEIPLNERKEPQCVSNYFVQYINGKWAKDLVLDEQSYILKTKEGLVVLTGDSHPGIGNILTKTKELFNDDIVAVIGSLHLMEISKEKLVKIVSFLKERYSETDFYLNHTISRLAWATLRKKLGEEKIHHFKVGKKVMFDC
jgi:7,8-dihydropterin-6-yl-methyl-4-(beta-D-ribofuranosyl)aminobenzene 5'-phosphate synthase